MLLHLVVIEICYFLQVLPLDGPMHKKCVNKIFTIEDVRWFVKFKKLTRTLTHFNVIHSSTLATDRFENTNCW